MKCACRSASVTRSRSQRCRTRIDAASSSARCMSMLSADVSQRLSYLFLTHRSDGVRNGEQRVTAQENFAAAGRSLAASISAAGLLLCCPVPALAADIPEPVYFGNGCFWGRQKDFIDAEQRIGRTAEQVTSVVGYAGGREVGPSGKVCYYYADPRTVYEKLGHAEVVSVQLDTDQGQAGQEFREFARTYFAQFRKTRIGMIRLDPQDAGPGYRNVVGLPGGVSSPLFKILQEANVNNMELREGQGNMYVQGQPVEGDELNVVWVVDSNKLPFYMAEEYHQFHDGLGKYFPREYTQGLKNVAAQRGLIHPTGCPEWPY